MPEEKESFTYIGIQIKQNPDSSIIINQDIYINLIQRIKWSKERMKERKISLKSAESII